MQNNSSRQEILERIAAAGKGRLAFVDSVPVDDDYIYKPVLPDEIACFKNELEAINGVCVICDDETDLYAKLKSFVANKELSFLFCRDTYIAQQLELNQIPFSFDETHFDGMQAGITGCEFLVARTGSVLVSSASQSGRQLNVFPPIHIVLAHVSQLVNYLDEALVVVQQKYGNHLPSIVSTITGPSRTADIEKTLVLGAHGPKEFVVFLSKM
ncbi:MAG TPA: lactate utilization protein [Paludibacter sp.]